MIAAIVAGYEVTVKLGIALDPSAHYAQGFHPTGTVGPFASAAAAGKVLALDESRLLDALGSAGNVIYLGRTLPTAARAARVVLPIANVAEEDGTFVNRDGRVQRYAQAKPAPGMARPAWWVLGELLAELGVGEAPASAAEALDAVRATVPTLGPCSYAQLGYRGVRLGEAAAAEVSA